jgi:hypothetical protein
MAVADLILWAPGRIFAHLFPPGFKAFASTAGVEGVARISDDLLELLAITSETPEATAQFIAQAKANFKRIAVWEFESYCARRDLLWLDFVPGQLPDPATGMTRVGLVWSQAHQAEVDARHERPINSRWTPLQAAEAIAAEANTKAVLAAINIRRAA